MKTYEFIEGWNRGGLVIRYEISGNTVLFDKNGGEIPGFRNFSEREINEWLKNGIVKERR